MKLLLVEDEKRMAAALMEILRLEKYEVDLCNDGRLNIVVGYSLYYIFHKLYGSLQKGSVVFSK